MGLTYNVSGSEEELTIPDGFKVTEFSPIDGIVKIAPKDTETETSYTFYIHISDTAGNKTIQGPYILILQG
jgi:hypothetical protein